MKNKVKRNLILALTTLTIGGIATIPNFVFANTAVNTPGTVTDSVNGVAIGSNSDSKGTGISIGANAKTEQPIGAIAIGNNADAVTAQSIAIGDGAIAGKNDMDNPQDPNNRTTVGKRSNIAIGTGAVAEGGRNISIGENTGKGTIDNWNIHNVNIGTEASQILKKIIVSLLALGLGLLRVMQRRLHKLVSLMSIVRLVFILEKRLERILQLMGILVLAMEQARGLLILAQLPAL